MLLPKLHYISKGDTPNEHLKNIQKACTFGFEWIQLAINNISDKKFLKIANEAREITAHFQTRLLITDHYKVAKAIKADGVFLRNKEISPTTIRNHIYNWQILGGAAHNLQDCKLLLNQKVDYISLGPYDDIILEDRLPETLDLNAYNTIVDVLKTKIPIIANGNITTNDVLSLLEIGIYGVAVSNEITNDFNIIRKFNELLKASSTKEQRHSFK
ncbi:thiamine phosphate synthase [Aquimarina sp. W85]|uniref:thiamine phosphate synthase n=1 Tax=Aquimarina rhodophyticola TaxID=3342246 RepID=UPI00366E23A5